MRSNMKKIFRKIKELFSKKPKKEWVALDDGAQTGFLKCSPEAVRKMIEEAYPDGAEFLSKLTAFPKDEGFMLDAGFASTSYVSARGINATCMMLTYEQLKELMEKYPGWQVLIPSISLIPPKGNGFYSDVFASTKGTNQ